ncbi:TPA: efflux transporter outer membrane subunit [Citrobacter freundii]|uniref:efflux transporter outer membrane subunit n=1 Tax=Citrobacter freundii TaxID=546 RepID=UPI001D033818|nr:efflux transporter outer membrane subunit [Citrobacter freundii]HCJ7330847.1 efflux transporter outer membrane subunit [Enterobacter hormaechei subsp. xiangfangensis]HCJ7359620.1 efflux transporter outer membrane subunit [Citrobacter freundii]
MARHLLLCSMLLSGCASLTRTPYMPPNPPMPARYEHARAEDTIAARQSQWWREFNDPGLNAVVDLAVARNPDLAAAAIRVRRATLQARRAGVALLPVPSGGGSTSLSRRLSGDLQRTTEAATSSISAAWEVDLFGRLAAERDAAVFEAHATAEDRDAVRLSLIGTAANLYWQIAFANEGLTLAEQSLAYAQRTRDLVETQYRAGGVSRLERREIEQLVAAQEAAITQLRQTRTEAREALRVLLDGAQTSTREPQELSRAALPAVAAGLPAELLRRRPDLWAAELRLRRTLASSDATRLSYYPTLSLTGSLGGSSTALLNVLANPVATLGSGLTLPFLNVPAMRLDTQIARTQFEEAVILFRKSLYTALAEAENALSARTNLAAQGAALRRSREAAIETERLYEIRYRAGAVPLRTWLDAQERRRQADIDLAANGLAQLQNHVALNQALGGGLGLDASR